LAQNVPICVCLVKELLIKVIILGHERVTINEAIVGYRFRSYIL